MTELFFGELRSRHLAVIFMVSLKLLSQLPISECAEHCQFCIESGFTSKPTECRNPTTDQSCISLFPGGTKLKEIYCLHGILKEDDGTYTLKRTCAIKSSLSHHIGAVEDGFKLGTCGQNEKAEYCTCTSNNCNNKSLADMKVSNSAPLPFPPSLGLFSLALLYALCSAR